MGIIPSKYVYLYFHSKHFFWSESVEVLVLFVISFWLGLFWRYSTRERQSITTAHQSTMSAVLEGVKREEVIINVYNNVRRAAGSD